MYTVYGINTYIYIIYLCDIDKCLPTNWQQIIIHDLMYVFA